MGDWRRCLRYLPLLCLLLLAGAPAAATVVLNEVLYDPPGADGGHEFVELVSTIDLPQSLAGVRLEFCNGADPGAWRLLWEGGAEDSLAAAGLFVLGESEVPERQHTVELALQNGPEALRLTRSGVVLDLLGYGDGLDASLYEAWPAGDPSGESLARRPDGVDTDQNALDWFAAEPTPGALNYPDFRVRLVSAEPALPLPAPGRGVDVTLRAANTGAAAWPAPLPVRLDGEELARLPAAAPERVAEVVFRLPVLPEGTHDLTLAVFTAAGLPVDTLALPLRVGLGPLQLMEVQFAPESGGEWVECRAREPLSGLEAFTLGDLSGTVSGFTPPALAAGERLLLCADREDLLAACPTLPADRLVELSPWPSLANGGASQDLPDWTDGLRLSDAAGRLSDAMLYRGEWVTAKGVSLERVHDYGGEAFSAWAACPVGATPLAAGAGEPSAGQAADAPPGDLTLLPNPFDPDRERTVFSLRATGAALTLRLFDGAGRDVQTLRGHLGAGQARLVWDGRDRFGRALPDGAYPFLLEWEGDGGGDRVTGVCGLLRGGRS